MCVVVAREVGWVGGMSDGWVVVGLEGLVVAWPVALVFGRW